MYSRVVSLSLNNTVEFLIINNNNKIIINKTERFDPKVFFSSIQKKPNGLFIYGQMTSDDVMTVQKSKKSENNYGTGNTKGGTELSVLCLESWIDSSDRNHFAHC